MLSKEEELRLASCIDVTKDEIENNSNGGDWRGWFGLNLKTQLWLAEKLKESNNELKKIDTELSRVLDKEWKAHWEYNREDDEREEAESPDINELKGSLTELVDTLFRCVKCRGYFTSQEDVDKHSKVYHPAPTSPYQDPR